MQAAPEGTATRALVGYVREQAVLPESMAS